MASMTSFSAGETATIVFGNTVSKIYYTTRMFILVSTKFEFSVNEMRNDAFYDK